MKLDKSSPIPRFYQLAEILEKKVVHNKSYKGEMLPPIERLAAEYDVSKVTVNKAIKILTDKGLLYGEVGRGTYIRKNHARKKKRIEKVVLVANEPEKALKFNYFIQSVSHSVEQQCAKNGIGFEFLAVEDSNDRKNYLENHLKDTSRGYVFVNRSADTEWLWSELDQAKIPYASILTAGTVDWPNHVQQVAIDEVNATRLCLRHLIKLGHRDIAYIGRHGEGAYRAHLVRYHAMVKTFKRYNIPLREELIVDIPMHEQDTRINGYKATSKLLARKEPFTALFAINDFVAAGAILCLKDHGIKVPEEVSVVGHDDDPYSSHFAPPLTTVRMDYGELGRRAFFALTNHKDAAAMKFKLIERESSAPVPTPEPVA